MFISEGNNEVEILVVEVSVDKLNIRCVGAYEPQVKRFF